MKINECTKYTIDGVDYVTIEDFCRLTDRSRTAVNNLIRVGNKKRKLKSLRLGKSKSFIPVSEYFQFPFSEGNRRNNTYYYLEDGSIKWIMEMDYSNLQKRIKES